MNQYMVVVGVAVGAIAVMAVVFGMDIMRMSVSVQDYDIFVDPIIDKQNLFVTGRITVQNTGHLPLTGLRVNFGDGDVLAWGRWTPARRLYSPRRRTTPCRSCRCPGTTAYSSARPTANCPRWWG